MNSLISENSTGNPAEIAEDVMKIFLGASRGDIKQMSWAQTFLNRHGRKTKVLKKPNPIKPADSYIIWFDIWNKTLAIKIHEDIFYACRDVYSNPALLQNFVDDGDLPNILETFSIHGYMIVIYLWQRWVNPAYLLRNHPWAHSVLQESLSRRISSILQKGYGLYSTPPEDFLYSRWVITLLDANQINIEPSKKQDADSETHRIYQWWLDCAQMSI